MNRVATLVLCSSCLSLSSSPLIRQRVASRVRTRTAAWRGRCFTKCSMKTIPLTQGKFAIVDDEDFEWLSSYSWSFHHAGYAQRGDISGGKLRMVFMHRQILGTPKGVDTDHVNGDGLDNRKSNLRKATRSENLYNQGVPAHNTTGFKGVCFNKRCGKFQAEIRVSGKPRRLGLFVTKEEAHAAYCMAAKKLHGKFARLK